MLFPGSSLLLFLNALDPKPRLHLNLSFNFSHLTITVLAPLVLFWCPEGGPKSRTVCVFSQTLWEACLGETGASDELIDVTCQSTASSNLLSSKPKHTHNYCQDLPVIVWVCLEVGCTCLVCKICIRLFCKCGLFLPNQAIWNEFLAVCQCTKHAYWFIFLRELRCDTVHFLNFKVPEATGFLPLPRKWHLLAYTVAEFQVSWWRVPADV